MAFAIAFAAKDPASGMLDGLAAGTSTNERRQLAKIPTWLVV
jgi:hypothetical protein